jgi:hypothetical protein
MVCFLRLGSASKSVGTSPQASRILLSALIVSALAMGFARAQDSGEEESVPGRTIKVTGVLQHQEGDIKRAREVPPAPDSPVLTLEPIYEGQGFVLGPGSRIKIATRERCTLVIYGPGRLRTRELKGQSEWALNARAWRSICPEGSTATLNENRVAIASQGELVAGPTADGSTRWYVAKRGHQSLGAIEIRPGEVAVRTGATFSRLRPQPHPYSVYLFDGLFPAPQESEPLPKPLRPLSTTVTLAPGIGRGFARYDNPQLTVPPSGAGSISLLIYNQIPEENRFWPGGIFVTALSFSGLNGPSSVDSSTDPDEYSDSSLFSIEGGGRLTPSWISPFARIGVGFDSTRIFVQRPDLGVTNRARYEFYQLTVAAGVDALVTPFRQFPFIGLYGAAEWRLETTLFRGGRYLESQSGTPDPAPEELDEPQRLTKFIGLFRMGASVQF